MGIRSIANQRGGTLVDKLIVVALIAFAVWAFRQYQSHPDGVRPVGETHSAYEDKPK
jgi:hypothetical protein